LILPTGHPVRHFDRIDSTNSEARRLAEKGECGPLWLLADEQTVGRGRLGRSWVSEPGNLYATFLFSLADSAGAASQISFVAALAVHDMVGELRPGLVTRIKWPNDVLVGGSKFCGILPEVVGVNPPRVAVGCGINVAHAPTGTPYPVTALGADLGRDAVLAALDRHLMVRLQQWDQGRGFSSIREDWCKSALGLGECVRVRVGDEQRMGLFKGLALDGALIMQEPDGSEFLVHAGEVFFEQLERLRHKTP
jgi:BirA family biotin operon repressor/biotin-[acetyl-CoA-carboxylase] ligase